MPSARTLCAALAAILAVAGCAPRRLVLAPAMPAPNEKSPFAGRDVILTQFRVRNAGEKDSEKSQADLKKGFLDYLRAHGGFASVTEGEAPTQGAALAMEVDLLLGLEDRKNFVIGFPAFIPLWGLVWPFTPRAGKARVTGNVSLLDAQRHLVGADTRTEEISFEFSLYGWYRTLPIEEAFERAYAGVFARLAAPERRVVRDCYNLRVTPSWVQSLQRRFEHWTVPHLSIYIAGMNAVVYLLSAVNPEFRRLLVLNPALLRSGEIWRAFTFLFIPPALSPLMMLFWTYLLYSYARALEDRWGEFPFNLYYGLGAAATIGASLLLGAGLSNMALNASIFLAFAALHPDFELLIFFFLPVKVKWLALFTWLAIAWQILLGGWTDRAALLAGVVNYAAFFGAQHLGDLKTALENRRHKRRYKDAFK